MTERTHRIIVGAIILLCLYFGQTALLWALVGLLAFEGITNWRVPSLVSRLRYGDTHGLPSCCGNSPGFTPGPVNFEAERGLRLVVTTLMVLTYGIFHQQLWVFPWFIGFALFSAGLSGICPMILFLKRLGLR
jgi:hypothetical protein